MEKTFLRERRKERKKEENKEGRDIHVKHVIIQWGSILELTQPYLFNMILVLLNNNVHYERIFVHVYSIKHSFLNVFYLNAKKN